MKLKNLSIATALLLALTGCGSSGGGNSDNPQLRPITKFKTTKQHKIKLTRNRLNSIV